jgi:hypothetical protein
MRPFAFVIAVALAGCANSSSPGTLHLSITDNAGSSVDLAPADFPIATGGKDTASGIYQFDAQLDRAGGGHRLVILNIHDTPGTPPTAAHSFVAEVPPVGGPFMAGHAIVTLTDVAADQQIATWQSTSGSVTIAAVAGERVSVHFDAVMEPAQYTAAQGSFHASGDYTVEHVGETSFLSAGP